MTRTLLISIHPRFVDLILKGEKKIEFRRSWAKDPVERMVIYATAPVMKIVAVVAVAEVLKKSPTALWPLAKEHGGGLTRDELRRYFNGKTHGYGICLGSVTKLRSPWKPSTKFESFQIPQSFRYLTNLELEVVDQNLMAGV